MADAATSSVTGLASSNNVVAATTAALSHPGVVVALVIVAATSALWMWLTALPKNAPPGPPRRPIFGNLHNMKHPGGPHLALAELSKKYGPIFSMKLGNVFSVAIHDPEIMYQCLMKQKTVFAGRAMLQARKALSNNGKGLAFSRYNAGWRFKHKLSHAALFNMGKVKSQGDHMSAQVVKLVKYMREGAARAAEDGHTPNTLAPQALLKLTTMNIISMLMMSASWHPSDPQFKIMADAVDKVLECLGATVGVDFLPHRRWIPSAMKPIAEMKKAQQALLAFIRPIVEEHCKSVDRENPRDLVDRLIIAREDEERKAKKNGVPLPSAKLLANGEVDPDTHPFDNEAISLTIMDILIGGTDTTSTTMEWLVALMACYPEEQRLLQQEIDSVVGPDRTPEVADLPNLPRLRAAITETLRLSTVVPMFRRTTTRDTSIVVKRDDGSNVKYDLPKGTMAYFNVWPMHHDPKNFPEPYVFRPDRFMTEEGRKLERNLMPFGVGVRQCIGIKLAEQELAIAGALMVQNLEFRLPKGVDSIDLRPQYGQTMHPAFYRVELVDRK